MKLNFIYVLTAFTIDTCFDITDYITPLPWLQPLTSATIKLPQ